MPTAYSILSALLGFAAMATLATPARADASIDVASLTGGRGAGEHSDDDRNAVSGGGNSALPPYLQCVPYARDVTGIQIRGDAWTWWGQAEGRYARGTRPKVGSVMAFQPHGKMELGHVAAVSRIVDSRTVLLRHANWSPINGRRGQIEDNVRAVDVSPENDWSQVRVWFAPIASLGSTAWPVQGFIYPQRERLAAKQDKHAAGRRAKEDLPDMIDPIGAIIARRLALKR